MPVVVDGFECDIELEKIRRPQTARRNGLDSRSEAKKNPTAHVSKSMGPEQRRGQIME